MGTPILGQPPYVHLEPLVFNHSQRSIPNTRANVLTPQTEGFRFCRMMSHFRGTKVTYPILVIPFR